MKKTKGSSQIGAMTLVETVLALGIVAIAIVPVLGTLGVALNTLQDSSNETARSSILNFVNSDLRTRAYGTNSYSQGTSSSSGILTNSANTTYYFDVQGNWVATGTPSTAEAPRILYAATPSGTNEGRLIRYSISIKWPYPTSANTNIMPGSIFSYE